MSVIIIISLTVSTHAEDADSKPILLLTVKFALVSPLSSLHTICSVQSTLLKRTQGFFSVENTESSFINLILMCLEHTRVE